MILVAVVIVQLVIISMGGIEIYCLMNTSRNRWLALLGVTHQIEELRCMIDENPEVSTETPVALMERGLAVNWKPQATNRAIAELQAAVNASRGSEFPAPKKPSRWNKLRLKIGGKP